MIRCRFLIIGLAFLLISENRAIASSGAFRYTTVFGTRDVVSTLTREDHVICDACPKRYKPELGMTVSLESPRISNAVKEVKDDQQDTTKEQKVAVAMDEEKPLVGHIQRASEDILIDNKCFEIVDIVLFKLDSYKVSDKARSRVMSKLNDIDRNTKIKLVGRTCDLGTKEYNMKLAQKRVESVASFLRNNGFTNIDIEWAGKCCYISDNREINRRVEIYKEVTK